jgi:hypothetical protein
LNRPEIGLNLLIFGRGTEPISSGAPLVKAFIFLARISTNYRELAWPDGLRQWPLKGAKASKRNIFLFCEFLRFFAAIFRLIFPAPSSLSGAAKCVHLAILAEEAKTAQLPGRGFFRERNPCKHWSKRVSSTYMSSMFS